MPQIWLDFHLQQNPEKVSHLDPTFSNIRYNVAVPFRLNSWLIFGNLQVASAKKASSKVILSIFKY